MTKIKILYNYSGKWYTPTMIHRYLELSGIDAKPYIRVDYNQLKPITIEEAEKEYDKWLGFDPGARIVWRKSDFTLFDIGIVERTDTNLIQAIEDVIDSKFYASKYRYFFFKIVEIPDDVKWHIEKRGDERDVYEVIIEDHREWK